MEIGNLLDNIPYDRIEEFPVWQRWLAAGVAILLIFLLYYSFSYRGNDRDIKTLGTKLKGLEDEYNKHERYIEKQPALEKEIERLNHELSFARIQLPDGKEIPELLTQISDLGSQEGLEFMLFKPLPEKRVDFYSKVPVEMNIIGRFHDIATFFDRVRRLTRVVNITDIKMKVKTQDKIPVLETKCKATTFKYIEGAAAAKKKKKKK